MELKTYFAQDRNGSLIPSAMVAIYLTGTNTLASGLTNVSNAPLSNPFTADADGKIQFHAPDGIYDMQVSLGSTQGVKVTFQCIDVEQQLADANTAADRAETAQAGAEQALADFQGQASGLLPKSDLAANDGEKYVGSCPTIATLRTIEPTSNGQRITLREHTAGTGYGGGQFRAVLAGTGYIDNNGTIIKTAGGAAWLRINADVVNPLMFGAVPRVDNTTPAAHVAINAAVIAASGKIFDGLGLTFNTADELLFNNINSTRHINLIVNALATAAIGNIIRVNGAVHVLRNIAIEGNSTDAAIGINQSDTAAGTIIERCRITNVGRNAILTAGKQCIVRNNFTDNCGYAGTGNFRCSIQMNEGEHCVMEGNTCLHCTWGILMRNEIGVTQGYFNTMRNNIVVSKSGTTADCQGISAAAQFHLTTTGNIVREFPNNGIDHQNCFGMLITNNQIVNCSDGVFIGDRSCGRIIISDNNMESCNNGVRYYNPSSSTWTGQTFSDVQITNNVIWQSKSYGIWVEMGGTTSANFNTRIDGNIVDGNSSTGKGIVLNNVSMSSVCNNQIRRVVGPSIDLATCEGIRVIGNTCLDSGVGSTAGTYPAINVNACSRTDISHNVCYGSLTSYLALITGGSFNKAVDNHARGNTGATAVSISGGTSNTETGNIKS